MIGKATPSEIPDRRAAGACEVFDHAGQHVQIFHARAADSEAARDGARIGPAEDRARTGEPLVAQPVGWTSKRVVPMASLIASLRPARRLWQLRGQGLDAQTGIAAQPVGGLDHALQQRATGFAAVRPGKGLYIIPRLFAVIPLPSGDWLQMIAVFLPAKLGRRRGFRRRTTLAAGLAVHAAPGVAYPSWPGYDWRQRRVATVAAAGAGQAEE